MQRSHLLIVLVTVLTVFIVILAVNNLLYTDPDTRERFIPDPDDPLGARITSEEAEAIAIEFLIGSPTYAFGSAMNTIEVMNNSPIPIEGGGSARFVVVSAYEITINFVSWNPGYGERPESLREGPRVCSCEHTIEVWVQGKVVTKAIIDETWDELKQEMLE